MKKICNKCRIKKSLKEFHKNKNAKDGYTLHCKLCRNETSKKYRQNNKKKIHESYAKHYQNNKEKICEKQKKYYQNNKKEIRKYYAKYYKDNKKKILEAISEYRQTSQGKATAARSHHKWYELIKNSENSLTNQQWSIILSLQQYKCANCGEYFDIVDPQRDHIIPASRGGPFIIQNIQGLCKICNSKKYDTIIDYRVEMHKHVIRDMI